MKSLILRERSLKILWNLIKTFRKLINCYGKFLKHNLILMKDGFWLVVVSNNSKAKPKSDWTLMYCMLWMWTSTQCNGDKTATDDKGSVSEMRQLQLLLLLVVTSAQVPFSSTHLWIYSLRHLWETTICESSGVAFWAPAPITGGQWGLQRRLCSGLFTSKKDFMVALYNLAILH